MKYKILMLLFCALPLYAQSGDDTELESITVHGDRHQETVIEKAGTSTTVTALEIEEKSSKLLKDTLTYMPGIQVQTERKGTRTFYMRGYGQDKVAITVDGVPVIDTFSGTIDIDNIGLLDVSEIVVQRGATSALYGTRGAAGAINIYKAPPQAPYAKAAAETDHLGNHFITLAHGARFGDFYYMLSGSYDKSFGYTVSDRLTGSRRLEWARKLSSIERYGWSIDALMANGDNALKYYVNDEGRWDHASHLKFKLNTKTGYFITPNLEVGLTGFFNRTKMESSIYHTDSRSYWAVHNEYEHSVWISPNYSYVLQNQSNTWPAYNDWSLSPFVNWTMGKFSLRANFYYYYLNNKYMDFLDPQELMPRTGADPENRIWSIWTNETLGFNLMPSYRLSDRQKLGMSVQWYRNSHIEEERYFNELATTVITNFGRNKYRTMEITADYFTLALEDEIKLNSYTDISAGISYDAQNLSLFQKHSGTKAKGDYEMTDVYRAKDKAMLFGTRDSFNPVIGVISEPLKDFFKWRASFSYKTSFPSLQAYSRVESKRKYEGTYNTDRKVRPEKSINGNAGVEFSFFSKRLVVASDFFYSYYYDKIMRQYLTQTYDYVYRNIKASYLTGLESSITYSQPDIFDAVDMSAGFTHTFSYSRNLSKARNSIINKGRFFEFQPVHKLTIDYRAVFPKTNTSFFLFGYFECGSIYYTMRDLPERVSTYGSDSNLIYSTRWFKPTKLHNPLMVDAKLSQKLFLLDDCELELYILCKNIFDDYLSDPFNPGPGRTWCFGVNASWNR